MLGADDGLSDKIVMQGTDAGSPRAHCSIANLAKKECEDLDVSSEDLQCNWME